MIGEMSIYFYDWPYRGYTNEPLQPPFRAEMTPRGEGQFTGGYEATLSLFDVDSGTAVNQLLVSTRTVDGFQERVDLINFNWHDLRITRPGRYQLEVSAWEKGEAPPKNPKDIHFGTAVTERILVISDPPRRRRRRRRR